MPRAFRWGEVPGSGNMTELTPSLEKVYFASGSTSESFVMNSARGNTPRQIATPMGVLHRQDIRLNWTGADHCIVTVPYGAFNREEIEINFDTAGGTVHITSSKSTVARYGVGGLNDAPDMKGTIGVNGDDVDGCDIVVPGLKLDVSFRYPAGAFSIAAIKSMARHTAYVNDDVFLTFAPGEVLFLGSAGRMGSAVETSVRHAFVMAENAVGENGQPGDKRLNFGDIANVVKQGHDYCWIRYIDDVDGGRPVKKAKHAYVERVYSRTSFRTLFGFGG